jgi:hypothetical protein
MEEIMKTPKAFLASYIPFTQTRLVCALLITLALLVPLRTPSTASAISAPAESTIVLETAGAPFLQGTTQVLHAGFGNETNPHVDCDVVSYTFDDFLGRSTIHYQNLATGVDTEIPGNAVDLLSDISGSHIAYTEVTNSGDTVRIFDTISETTTIVPGFGRSNPSIGGNLVAFEDVGSSIPGGRDIDVYDLSSGIVTTLAHDSFDNIKPAVSPNGDAVIWHKCLTNQASCDLYAAIQTSPGVFTTRALISGGNSSRSESSSTNGELAVYTSLRNGERDLYYQPLTGGTEVHLSIPSDQRDVTISGDLISFESGTDHGYDIFVYDIRSGRLFQATNTLLNEKLSDISVCGDTGRIGYVNLGNGAFDLYAFTFQVPSVPADTEDQLNDLIALIRGFNLPPGVANSLMRKLQNALDAVNASDTATACNLLTAFINECQAQSGKKLTPEQSTQLITAANHIKTDLGCP